MFSRIGPFDLVFWGMFLAKSGVDFGDTVLDRERSFATLGSDEILKMLNRPALGNLKNYRNCAVP